MPMPPPTHIVSTPQVLSRVCSPLITVSVIRVPVDPYGCPSGIPPPWTLSLSDGMPRSREEVVAEFDREAAAHGETRLAAGQAATQDQVVDVLRLDLWRLVEQRAYDLSCQVVWGQVSQGPVKARRTR